MRDMEKRQVLERLDHRQIRQVLSVLQKSMDDYLYVYDFAHDTFDITSRALKRFALPGSYFEDAVNGFRQVAFPRDYPMLIRDLDKCRKGEQETHNLEYRWMGRNGEVIWINCRGTVVLDKNGRKILIGCISEIGKKARADDLTGLRREERFLVDTDSLLQARADRIGYCMRIGVDNFKEINEKYGMDVGDEVLKELADCIIETMSNEVNIYRLVADEFILVAGNGESVESAKRAYHTLKDAIVRRVKARDYDRFYTVSVGVLAGPFEGRTGDEILKLTEFALNEAKRKGRNRLAVFRREDYDQYIRRLNIRKVLRRDIGNNFHGFSIFFQPIVKADTFEITSAEALLRWTSEEYGSMPPSEFIPVMEESGLIIPIGRFVMDRAAEVCKEWQKIVPGFYINVNLSYVQMHKSDIMADIRSCVNRAEIEPDSIMMELTESGYIETDSRIRRMIRDMCEFQVRLAIDDFGTGYSNIRYLKEIQAQVVKIDRSFVMKAMENEHDLTLIHYITLMSHSLGLKVCMEGIETPEEMERIRLAEPDLIQGFLFGHPMCKEDFDRLLRKRENV